MNAQQSHAPRADILLISGDLMVASELQGVAQMTGAGFLQLRSAEAAEADLGKIALAAIDLAGLDARTLKRLVDDLQSQGILVVAFGPHVQADRLKSAKQMGCDCVVTRGSIVGEVRAALSRLP